MTPRCATCGQDPDAPSMFELACPECLANVELLTDEEMREALEEGQRDVEACERECWPLWGPRFGDE
jgi:hypothetical protein